MSHKEHQHERFQKLPTANQTERNLLLKIATATRFDDVDHDTGYESRGFNYVIQNGEDTYMIRTYDDEPGEATVMYPKSMSKHSSLRVLVGFLQCELGISRVSLYKGELGIYAEIDLDSLESLSA